MYRLTPMATKLSIDPALLNEALAVGGEKTKKATVTKALQEFIARRRQRELAELFGKLDWDGDFDFKRERSRLGFASMRISRSRVLPTNFRC